MPQKRIHLEYKIYPRVFAEIFQKCNFFFLETIFCNLELDNLIVQFRKVKNSFKKKKGEKEARP